MINLLIVGAGGFLGSVFRYLLGGWTQRLFPASTFPYGTLTVNVIGCLVIGLLRGLVDSRGMFTPEVRTFLLIGLLGGFTTFSSFGFETFALARDAEYIPSLLNIGLNVILGLGAVWLGYILARLL
jgi:CrcB protein